MRQPKYDGIRPVQKDIQTNKKYGSSFSASLHQAMHIFTAFTPISLTSYKSVAFGGTPLLGMP